MLAVRSSSCHVAVLAALAIATSCRQASEAVMPVPLTTVGDLETLAERTIYFGHQSVGDNILAGVARLLARHPGIGPTLVTGDDPTAARPGTWVHARVGRNEDPQSKIADFARRLEGGLGDRVDLAFLKLCYIDFAATTDVSALFDRYQQTLGALAARYPRTAFVHVTAPLTTVSSGLATTVKRALGRPIWGEVENARRHQYNEQLRRRFGGNELFDLAAVEATDPAHGQRSFEWQGQRVPALLPIYTADGGHLNERGQDVVSDALVHFLADVARAAAGP